jgi:hypothetical protein
VRMEAVVKEHVEGGDKARRVNHISRTNSTHSTTSIEERWKEVNDKANDELCEQTRSRRQTARLKHACTTRAVKA